MQVILKNVKVEDKMTSLKTRTALAIILALSLVASLAGVVMADWPTDPSTNTPVVTAANNQGAHRIIADGSGGFFAVWQDCRNGESCKSGGGIYAQRFDADGNRLWTINGVPVCTDSNNQTSPRICLDGSGGCIISWVDCRGDSDTYIYAQRLNGEGIAQWANNGVMVSQSLPDKDQLCPWLVSDGQGGAIISWRDISGGVYLQRLSSSGSMLWGGYVQISGTGNEWGQKLIPDGQGGAIITWVDLRGLTDRDIYIQRVDSSGNELWGISDVVVCNATDDQFCPRIIPAGDGAIVIWWDNSHDQIFAQKVNGAGTAQWTNNGVCVFSGSYVPYTHGIASDGADGAIITWADDADDNVYARRIGSSGNLMWGIPTQITNTGDFNDISHSPRKTVEDGAGGAITVWMNDDFEIYAQRVDGTGSALWTENGVLLCDAETTTEGGRGCPRLVACDTNCGATGALAYWRDSRNKSSDIYMQGIDPEGNLGKPCPECFSPPVGGKAYPVNKVDLVMPMIVLGIAALAGASLVWQRRRYAS